MEPKEKKAFEPSGLVPRSIVRTFERFRQQLLPGSETAAIREYRISRYQVLVSARCLFTLLIIPIATNWLVSSWLLSPLVEHFWNTQQNEIFLNSYQEERAFAELESFSEKLFFESLLNTANAINVDFAPVTPYVTQRGSKEGLAQQLGSQTLLISHYPESTWSRQGYVKHMQRPFSKVWDTQSIKYVNKLLGGGFEGKVDPGFAKSSTHKGPSHAYLSLSRILAERGRVQRILAERGGGKATSTRSKEGFGAYPEGVKLLLIHGVKKEWSENITLQSQDQQFHNSSIVGTRNFAEVNKSVAHSSCYASPYSEAWGDKGQRSVEDLTRYAPPYSEGVQLRYAYVVALPLPRSASMRQTPDAALRFASMRRSKEEFELVKSLPYKPLFSAPSLTKYDKSISSDGILDVAPPRTYAFGVREMEGDFYVDALLPLRVLTSSEALLPSSLHVLPPSASMRERDTGVSVLALPLPRIPLWGKASMRERETGVLDASLPLRGTGFVTIPCNSANPINDNSLKIKEKVQNKILELAVYYNQQTIRSITNIVGDVVSLVTLGCLFIWMKPEITILKSFLIEAIYSLSDTTKSFLLILLTDLLVGFHSPRGWETALELLLKHFGLPENQDFVFLFVATFPVLLDTVFKYWIFRHLNKISPSTVATYHSMIE